MIAVQASGCAPIARAWKEGAAVSRRVSKTPPPLPPDSACPSPTATGSVLDIVRESGGTIIDLPDKKRSSRLSWIGRSNEGLLLCPEGACATAAYDHLLATGFLKPKDRVVLFKYRI